MAYGICRIQKLKAGSIGRSSDPIDRAVLVESPIDAMSFAVLDRTDSRKMIYLSTDGAGQVPLESLRTLPAIINYRCL